MSETQPAVVAPPDEEPERKAKRTDMMRVGERGLQLTTLDEMWRFAQAVSSSGAAPKGMQRPEQILVALQTGMEAGLSPMAALRSVVVINGVPSWKGDMALALVRASGKLAYYEDRIEGEGEARQAVVITQRRDQQKPVVHTFGVMDAKRARLWGKEGPWSQYPDRMLRYRALGFALRDEFSDVLQGGVIAEEAHDFPPPRDVTPAEAPAPRVPPTVADPVMALLAAAGRIGTGHVEPGAAASPVEVVAPVAQPMTHAEADAAIAAQESAA